MPIPINKRKQTLASKIKRVRAIQWALRPEILCSENIPKPLHGVAPRVVLGDKWWNQTRKAAYASTAYHCVACGDHKSQVKGNRKHLEGHELYDIDYPKGLMVYIETVPLCNWCHSYVHDGRLTALMEQGVIPQQKYVAVIQHGDEVLNRYNMVRPSRKERDEVIALQLSFGKIAEWSKWRLVVNGKQYKPRYKDLKSWEKAHS